LRGGSKVAAGRFKVERGESQVFEIALAVAATGRFACGLDCRQEQSDENRDDGDDDEEFDESERGGTRAAGALERHRTTPGRSEVAT
jgi:hypothetical protein